MPQPAHQRRSIHPQTARLGAVLAIASALAAAPVHGQPVGGDGFAPGSAVAAVVTVPKPWYAPRMLVTGRMRDTVPRYAAEPGLAFKAYSFARADGAFGGLYLWRDLAAARAHFDAAWFARVARERGVPGQVRFFEVATAIDNTPGGTPRQLDSTAVGTLVTVPVPAGATRETLLAGFQAELPADRQVPGLLVKAWVLTGDGRMGSLSLWQDAVAAGRWFEAGWQQRERQRLGAEPRIEWFDTPILLPTGVAAHQPAIPGWTAAHSARSAP